MKDASEAAKVRFILVHACGACVCACMRACMRACLHMCVCVQTKANKQKKACGSTPATTSDPTLGPFGSPKGVRKVGGQQQHVRGAARCNTAWREAVTHGKKGYRQKQKHCTKGMCVYA